MTKKPVSKPAVSKPAVSKLRPSEPSVIAEMRARVSKPPVDEGWEDVSGSERGEFFSFATGAALEGVTVGDARTVDGGRYGPQLVRDVRDDGGALWTVAPKGFCKRILEVPHGSRIRLEVFGGGGGIDTPWEGRLLVRKEDVPF